MSCNYLVIFASHGIYVMPCLFLLASKLLESTLFCLNTHNRLYISWFSYFVDKIHQHNDCNLTEVYIVMHSFVGYTSQAVSRSISLLQCLWMEILVLEVFFKYKWHSHEQQTGVADTSQQWRDVYPVSVLIRSFSMIQIYD